MSGTQEPLVPEIPSKKRKYYTSFNNDWLIQAGYKNWLKKENEFTGKCKLCGIAFVVKHDGEKAVKAHQNSVRHKQILSAQNSHQLLTNFFTKKDSTENLRVTISELSMVYHTVKHQHSYNSFDCTSKLNSLLYYDSSLAKQIHCGRTKASSLTENVLGPKAIELVVNDLTNDSQETTFFSISSDATNKGNIKLFPLIVTYFIPEQGIKKKILDFYSDDFESSEAISEKIIACLEKHGLSLNNVTAYSADNAAVNYGKYKSVYQKLSCQNQHILKANCNCHVLHNAAKFACKKLSLDVETLVNKIYSEFSTSTTSRRELQECFDFFNMEFKQMVRDVPTRWLSLSKAVDRILSSWPAIKTYFLSQEEENCDGFIWKIVKSEENEIPELNLYFVSHFLNFMCESILMLEKEDISSTELHDVMFITKEKLELRLRDNFFGAKVRSSMKNLSQYSQKKFTNEAREVYSRALSYIQKYYDFENSYFKHLSALNIKKVDLNFETVVEVAHLLNLNVNEDTLYDEINVINQHVSILRNDHNCLTTESLWVSIFKTAAQVTNIKRVVSKVMSIPVSNAFPERVFSIMESIWRGDRNRMRLDLVKAEIATNVNFDMNCEQFVQYLKASEQKSLLLSAQSDKKYNFRKSICDTHVKK